MGHGVAVGVGVGVGKRAASEIGVAVAVGGSVAVAVAVMVGVGVACTSGAVGVNSAATTLAPRVQPPSHTRLISSQARMPYARMSPCCRTGSLTSLVIRA
ncbi:MAG TPA: hypothetical protein DCL15_21535 [Chloroflexi bacterium]|nr:hypothetical protein [Chloroflexota bacterium]